MSVILYFSVGFSIFIIMVICMYFCNGFKVVSAHNRRKPVRRHSVFIITARVPDPRVTSSTTNETSSNSTGVIVHAPPPPYTTIDLIEASTSRNEASPPPPSYDEATKITY